MTEFPSKPLIQKGRIMLDPPPDRDVIHGQASLRHDLFQIPIAQRISQVPTDAKHDDDIGEVSPTECRWLGSICNTSQKRLLSWTEEDARNVFGDALAHRFGYDNFHSVISDINTYSDPTLLMQKTELAFDVKTKRLTNVYLYPMRMTWEDCKKLWGENVIVQKNVAVNDGSKFHVYKDRHLNVLLDRHNNVVSLGLY